MRDRGDFHQSVESAESVTRVRFADNTCYVLQMTVGQHHCCPSINPHVALLPDRVIHHKLMREFTDFQLSLSQQQAATCPAFSSEYEQRGGRHFSTTWIMFPNDDVLTWHSFTTHCVLYTSLASKECSTLYLHYCGHAMSITKIFHKMKNVFTVSKKCWSFKERLHSSICYLVFLYYNVSGPHEEKNNKFCDEIKLNMTTLKSALQH